MHRIVQTKLRPQSGRISTNQARKAENLLNTRLSRDGTAFLQVQGDSKVIVSHHSNSNLRLSLTKSKNSSTVIQHHQIVEQDTQIRVKMPDSKMPLDDAQWSLIQPRGG